MKAKKILITTFIAASLIFIINLIAGASYAVWKNLPYFFIYSLVFSLGNMLYFNMIDKFLNWDNNPEKTLFISILGVIPLNAFIYFLLNLFFKVFIFGQSFQYFIQHINPLEYTMVVLFALVIALFIITKYSFKKIREAQLKAEQLKTQNERIKFESLKAQLDPHFLFNNLNVLASLIGENPDKAEEFTLKLSDIYQYVLAQKDKNLVPLKDEITFAENYLDLLKMRFEDGLNYTLPKQINPEAQIPPLSLQLLLENAIKHNKISAENPLNIHIETQPDKLIVWNNYQPKQPAGTTGIGLKNIQKRYDLLTEKQVKSIQDKQVYRIELPILKA